MRQLYVADVGDGLCMAFKTIFGDLVQVDCGSRNSEMAFNGLQRIYCPFASPDIFILSHFHIDHYNGLLYHLTGHAAPPRFHIREVYYPRIPEFEKKEEFFYALFTINMRIFGRETGVQEYDFLNTILNP